jgi:hypothetical protein
MIRFGLQSPTVRYIDDASADYLSLVAVRHGVERFRSDDGLRWNVVVPLPAADLVLVYTSLVEAGEVA